MTAQPLPDRRRTLAELLDREYDYRESITWKSAGDAIETASVPIRVVDPQLNVDGVAMYLVRFRVKVTRNRGKPNERTSRSTRIARRGFATEAKAIGYAMARIDGKRHPEDHSHEDAVYLGSPKDRQAAHKAHVAWLRGLGSLEAWVAARAKLPGAHGAG